MAKVSLQNLSKSYGGRDLLKDFSLEIPGGTRLAVVGANGAGKSTLLKLIAGVSEPDGGKITLSTGARLGYVAQDMDEGDLGMTLLAWVMAALPSWKEFWVRYDAAVADGDKATLEALAAEQTRMEHALGYNPEHRAKTILTGLGFEEANQQAPLSALSGGWRERAKLARVLTAGADVLLLDEPTNHLDLDAIAWLESFLSTFSGVLIFVAHDRVFLDRVATHTLYMGEVKPVWRPGSFSEFLVWRSEMEKQWERQAAAIDNKIKQHSAFVDRFRYKATKARQAQSKLKSVDKLEKELSALKSERPDTRAKTLNFSLPEPERSDKTVAAAAELAYAYPGREPIWPPLTFQLFRGQKVALVGPNGAGKTTLLKLVIGALRPAGGRVLLGTGVKVGYYSQHQTEILNVEALVMSLLGPFKDPGPLGLGRTPPFARSAYGEPYRPVRPTASAPNKGCATRGGSQPRRTTFLGAFRRLAFLQRTRKRRLAAASRSCNRWRPERVPAVSIGRPKKGPAGALCRSLPRYPSVGASSTRRRLCARGPQYRVPHAAAARHPGAYRLSPYLLGRRRGGWQFFPARFGGRGTRLF